MVHRRQASNHLLGLHRLIQTPYCSRSESFSLVRKVKITTSCESLCQAIQSQQFLTKTHGDLTHTTTRAMEHLSQGNQQALIWLISFKIHLSAYRYAIHVNLYIDSRLIVVSICRSKSILSVRTDRRPSNDPIPGKLPAIDVVRRVTNHNKVWTDFPCVEGPNVPSHFQHCELNEAKLNIPSEYGMLDMFLLGYVSS